MAKKTGMRVDEFGIGFPPKLWSYKKGETEYSLNSLPIGGFVKIAGENYDEATEDIDRSRYFGAKSKWSQALVLIAGVAMNVIFAWFLFVIIFTIGLPSSVGEEEAGDSAKLVITEVIENSPAKEVGLPVGAEVTGVSSGVDFDQILKPTSFSAFVEDHTDSPINITYLDDEVEKTVVLTPRTEVVESDLEKPAVGVALSLIEIKKYSIFGALREASVTTVTSLVAITVGATNLIAGALTFSADLSQVAGPVGMVGLVGEAASFGLTSLLLLTAFISLNLAIINMLPVPALDGGRLLFVLIEALIRKPINPIWMSRVNFVGFALLMLLMVAVTYNDVLRLI